jgi:hypothetical protein
MLGNLQALSKTISIQSNGYTCPDELIAPLKLFTMKSFYSEMRTYAFKSVIRFSHTLNETEEIRDKIFKSFLDALPSFKKRFVKSFEQMIKAGDYPLSLQTFVMNLFEQKIKLLRLNASENPILEEKWEKFQFCVAKQRYSYTRNATDLDFYKDFQIYLTENLSLVDEPVETQISDEQWATLNSIYSNIDLLELKIGQLCSKNYELGTDSFLKIPVPHLVLLFNRLVSQAIEILQKYPQLMQARLKALLAKPEHPVLNTSKADLTKTEKYNSILLKALAGMTITNLENLKEVSDGIEILRNVFKENSSLIMFKNNHNILIIIKFIIDHIKHKNMNDDPAKIFVMSDFNNTVIGPISIQQPEGSDWGKWTLEQLEDHYLNVDLQFKCHQWADLFISPKLDPLFSYFQAINLWISESKTKKRFDIFLHAINEQNFSLLKLKAIPRVKKIEAVPQEQPELDTITDFICGNGSTNKNNSTKPKRTAPQPTASKKAQDIPQSTPIKPAEKSIKLKPESKPSILPLENKCVIHLPIYVLTEQLTLLMHKNQFLDPISPKKIALRHSILYLNSLFASFTAMQDGMKSKMPTKPLPHVVAVTQNAHYFLEQFLSYIAQEKGVDFIQIENCSHNLKRFWKQINNAQVDSRVINLFYLSNIWNSYPFEQKDKWDEIENERRRPEGLDLIHKTIKIQQDPEIIHKLTGYFHATVTFAQDLITHELPELKDSEEKIPATRDIAPLKQTHKLILTNINKAVADCHKILTDWESRSNHIVISKLKQAHLGLLHLQEHLKELNQQTVISDQIAPHVRNSIYWMHLSLEGVMQTIYALQSGVICKEHSLTTLFELIQWTNAVKPEKKEELVKWQNLHNLSRYPFNDQEVSSKAHELILKGEMLSDHPEYNEGFKLQALTPLEMIKISDENLTLANITKELEILLNSGFEMLEKRLLPQLKVNLV